MRGAGHRTEAPCLGPSAVALLPAPAVPKPFKSETSRALNAKKAVQLPQSPALARMAAPQLVASASAPSATGAPKLATSPAMRLTEEACPRAVDGTT